MEEFGNKQNARNNASDVPALLVLAIVLMILTIKMN